MLSLGTHIGGHEPNNVAFVKVREGGFEKIKM